MIHFTYLTTATTKLGANETRVISIKLSKTNPPKTTETRGKIFFEKIFRCRDQPIKTVETSLR